MPNRTYTAGSSYRYGFNGKEEDDEVSGDGNSYNFDARMYDPRLGRWFSTDAKGKPHLTPYNFVQNNSPNKIDPDGNDDIHFHFTTRTIAYTSGAGTSACSTYYKNVTTASIVVIKTNGSDRFYHHKHYISASGNTTERVKEFHPFWESSRSGLTTTAMPFSAGLINRNDRDVHTLAKYYDASPAFRDYLDKRMQDPQFKYTDNYYNYTNLFFPNKSHYNFWNGVSKGAEITAGILSLAGAGLSMYSTSTSLGGGRIFNHFTNVEGVSGITGVSAESLNGLKIGETITVKQLNFGKGTNGFMANNAGDIFVTELGTKASAGQLNQIGVFGSKQTFAISFSEEAAFSQGVRVTGANPSRSIFTIPGNSTIRGTFRITRKQ